MNPIIEIFNLIFYKPLFNGLIFLYQFLPGRDFGISIIFLTILIRLILFPFTLKSLKSQKLLAEIQPKFQEIQKKYKNNKERQVKEFLSLYQKEKINPFGNLLFLFIQLPILIALYQVFWKGLRPEAMENLYSFISNPGLVNPNFLGLIDLSKNSLILALLAGFFQFFQTKMVTPQIKKNGVDQFSKIFQNQLLYFSPLLTFFILLKLPAALSLYWITNSLFLIFQQKIFLKKYDQSS